MTLDERLADLRYSSVATWVLDPDEVRIVWANERALSLWNAESREELFQRPLTPVPPSVQARLDAARLDLRAGRMRVDDIMLYPKGVPTAIWLHYGPIVLEDGRLWFLQQAVERSQGDPTQLRMTEAFLHAVGPIACVRFDGQILLQNPAAIATFGATLGEWPAWLCDPGQGSALLQQVEQDGQARAEVRVLTLAGERTHAVDLCRIRDAVSGDLVALVQHSDQTERRKAEAQAQSQSRLAKQLEAALAQIADQHRQIMALSAPLLEVEDGVLALPLIGQLDAHRIDGIASRVLPALVERRTRALLFDLTGVVGFDEAGTRALLRIVAALRLLGVRPYLCGIGAALARTLSESGMDATHTPHARSLAEAIALARRRPR
jgi:rsbT co-antagonist protein RsbR